MHQQDISTTAPYPTEDIYQQFAVDPRISYPSYMPMDTFMDVERLCALDSYITTRIERRIQAAANNDTAFFTGPYRLEADALARPGTKMIRLSCSERPDSYFDLDQTELWHPTEAATEFSELMDFIATLPFKATGRMLIMYDTEARPVSAHRDHIETSICHDFIWMRTSKKKPFYMLNHITGEKLHVESYSAWFDSVNQFHGREGYDGLSFSIRVDGIFTDEFKAQIPQPAVNPASAPSLWAALSGQ
jgi:hypothetical protein